MASSSLTCPSMNRMLRARYFAQHGLSLIYLLAPTSTDERIAAVANRASGFIYLVSLTGVTGARDQVAADFEAFVGRVRALTDTPLAVGFGISRREHVAEVGKLVPAAIIGSALTTTIASAPVGDRAAAVERYLEVVTGRRSEETSTVNTRSPHGLAVVHRLRLYLRGRRL